MYKHPLCIQQEYILNKTAYIKKLLFVTQTPCIIFFLSFFLSKIAYNGVGYVTTSTENEARHQAQGLITFLGDHRGVLESTSAIFSDIPNYITCAV